MKTYNHPRHGNIIVTDHVHFLIEKDKRESCPQRTPEWYEKRKNHLTASALATACNDNPYETRMTLLKKKTGYGPAFTGNAATEHGNKYEQEAIEKYEKMTGEKVIEFGLLESLNPGEEFLAGSPDGITASGRAIEVKCPFRRTPTSKVPIYYVYQVQMIMQILQLDVCDFIQYVPETTWKAEMFIITTVHRDQYFWQAKLPMIRRFWDEVLEVREAQARGEQEKIKQILGDDIDDSSEDDEGESAIESGQIINIVTPAKCHINPDTDCEMDDAPHVQVIDEEGNDSDWALMTNFFEQAIDKQ